MCSRTGRGHLTWAGLNRVWWKTRIKEEDSRGKKNRLVWTVSWQWVLLHTVINLCIYTVFVLIRYLQLLFFCFFFTRNLRTFSSSSLPVSVCSKRYSAPWSDNSVNASFFSFYQCLTNVLPTVVFKYKYMVWISNNGEVLQYYYCTVLAAGQCPPHLFHPAGQRSDVSACFSTTSLKVFSIMTSKYVFLPLDSPKLFFYFLTPGGLRRCCGRVRTASTRRDYSSQQAVRLHTYGGELRAAVSSIMSVFMDLNLSYMADRSRLQSLIETAAHRESPRSRSNVKSRVLQLKFGGCWAES